MKVLAYARKYGVYKAKTTVEGVPADVRYTVTRLVGGKRGWEAFAEFYDDRPTAPVAGVHETRAAAIAACREAAMAGYGAAGEVDRVRARMAAAAADDAYHLLQDAAEAFAAAGLAGKADEVYRLVERLAGEC